jgi:soluble lytic murein transglycosylase-like protein
MDVTSLMAASSRVAEITRDVQFATVSFASVLAEAQNASPPAAATATGPAAPSPTVSTGLPVPKGEWSSRLPEAGRKWAGAIEQVATEKGIDPRLLAAIVWAESGFNENAVSSAGATGLTQLMPGTAAGLGVDPNDPMSNLRGGAEYIKRQLANTGRLDLALACYNAGPGNVQKYGGVPPFPETKAYIGRVMGYYSQLGGNA